MFLLGYLNTRQQLHSIEIEAASLFAAAYHGIKDWARLWWFSPDDLIEVRAGEQCWHVRAKRVCAWYAAQFESRR
jgi:hypothetical protein